MLTKKFSYMKGVLFRADNGDLVYRGKDGKQYKRKGSHPSDPFYDVMIEVSTGYNKGVFTTERSHARKAPVVNSNGTIPCSIDSEWESK